jgi:hypothetical protein
MRQYPTHFKSASERLIKEIIKISIENTQQEDTAAITNIIHEVYWFEYFESTSSDIIEERTEVAAFAQQAK